MSKIFTYVAQDAAIYQSFPSLNSGIDEILECGKTAATSSTALLVNNNSRSLIKFDLTNISSSYSNGTISNSAVHYLNLYIANATSLQRNQELDFFIVSGSWSEGSGYFVDYLVNPVDGVTWLNKDQNGNVWINSGSDYINDGIAPSSSMLFTYPPQNVRLNVTSFVQSWVSGNYENDGFVIKLPNADEINQVVSTNIKFYSGQSHTMFVPSLETLWNDQVYTPDTSSMSLHSLLPTNGYKVYFKNVQPVYLSGSVSRIDIGARSETPVKTYDTVLTFASQFYLPVNSYFSIVDTQTNAVVSPFDVGNSINTDTSGSYINLSTQNLYPNRYYKILMKINNVVIDSNTQFLVE